ncbi:hypothetical protein [Mycolicibacterium thermoresistibile]
MILDWDIEVDVVCAGGGVAALASAIVTVEDGGEVYVAGPGYDAAQPTAASLTEAWLGPEITDTETVGYFRALSADLASVGMIHDAVIPTREVVNPPPFDPRRQVEPFIGSRLRDWAGHCLASPFGLLHTRVSDRGMDTMHTPLAEVVEVKVVGSWPAGTPPSGSSVAEWLAAEADDRDIAVHHDDRLRRIVFEEGEVAGVVLATPDGPRSVRARHGISMTPTTPVTDTAAALGLTHYQHEIRIGLVSQTASRFGRLEVLTTAPAQRGSTSRSGQPDGGPAPESRLRRELHRYPPPGQ